MKFYRKTIGVLFIGLVAFAIVGSVATTVFADELQYYPLAPLPGTTNDRPPEAGGPPSPYAKSLPDYLISIFKLLIGLAGVLAVVEITIGGIQYMSTDAIYSKSEGKERIQQAILGLVLAIGAWLILYTVNPATLKFQFNPIQAPVSPRATTTPSDPNVNPYNPRNLPPSGTLPPGWPLPANFPANYPDNGWYKIYTCVRKSDGVKVTRIQSEYPDATYPRRDDPGIDRAAAACLVLQPPVGYSNVAADSQCSQIRYDCVRAVQ